MTKWHTAELVATAKRYDCNCDVLELVMEKIRYFEDGGQGGHRDYNSKPDHTGEIWEVIGMQTRKYGHASVKELWYWISRLLAVVSVLMLMIFVLAF